MVRTARVRTPAASDPAEGSVSAKLPTASPLAIGRSQRSFCSGVPNFCRISQVGALCTLISVETEPSPAEISSTTCA